MVVGVFHLTHQIKITDGSSHDAANLLAACRPALPPAGRQVPTASSRSNTSTLLGGYDVSRLFQATTRLDHDADSPENMRRRRCHLWACSSVGRAPALQAGGRRFEPGHVHQFHRPSPSPQRKGLVCSRRGWLRRCIWRDLTDVAKRQLQLAVRPHRGRDLRRFQHPNVQRNRLTFLVAPREPPASRF